MICQRQEEFQEPCKVQCEHCKEYYAPLEEHHAAADYADSIGLEKYQPDWTNLFNAFLAGCEYAKNLYKNSSYDDSDSDKIF
jgi:hypothetical protein